MTGLSINLSERAARKVREILEAEASGEGLALRVFIAGQTCCGYRYGMMLDDQVLEGDIVVQNNGVKIVVDKYSAAVMDGAEIDYVEGKDGKGFVIHNPNESSSCSCGGHHR
jgi:iron-sulfur cluster insertion protein